MGSESRTQTQLPYVVQEGYSSLTSPSKVLGSSLGSNPKPLDLCFEPIVAAQVAWLLLEAGSNKDSVDDDGDTALLGAASRGHLNAVRMLLEALRLHLRTVSHLNRPSARFTACQLRCNPGPVRKARYMFGRRPSARFLNQATQAETPHMEVSKD